MARLGILDQIQIASPCPASWSEMVGDERTRFCSDCRKQVHNIATMTTADALALLQSSESGVCIQIYRRQDGTVLTADCPVGLRARASARLRRIAGGLTAAAAVLFAGLSLKTRMDEDAAGSAPTPVAGRPPSLSLTSRLREALGLLIAAPASTVMRGEAPAILGKVPCPAPAPVPAIVPASPEGDHLEGSRPHGPADHPE